MKLDPSLYFLQFSVCLIELSHVPLQNVYPFFYIPLIIAHIVQLSGSFILFVSTLCFLCHLVNYGLEAAHVSSICRSGFFQLRQLRSIRRSLTTDATQALLQAFIACRLDYCNSLLSLSLIHI